MKRWPVACALALVACGSTETPPPGAIADSAIDTLVEEDDAGADTALPPLDPAACPKPAPDDPALSFSRDYVPLFSSSVEEAKAFYVVSVLEMAPGVRDTLAADATLAAVAKDREARFRDAVRTCAGKLDCIVPAVSWSDADAKTAVDAVVAALTSASMIDLVADGHLRPSGMFNLHAADPDDVLLREVLLGTLREMNAAVSSIGGEAKAAQLDLVLKDLDAKSKTPLSFHRPLAIAVNAVLLAADRTEAMRYEPLAGGENAKAVARIPKLDFASFPFTAIVVPGLGPNTLDTPLSEGGRDRCDLAAARFAAKLAPLIVLSGGHVHPDRTPYSEAIEMKKYLMSAHAIPEDALLVDPHARHTTTNLRNVSRSFFRYGVPTDRPALVTTDLGQTLYMQTTGFPKRNDTELGYRPWRVLFQLSSFDTCFVPTRMSLHADGRDPLDP